MHPVSILGLRIYRRCERHAFLSLSTKCRQKLSFFLLACFLYGFCSMPESKTQVECPAELRWRGFGSSLRRNSSTKCRQKLNFFLLACFWYGFCSKPELQTQVECAVELCGWGVGAKLGPDLHMLGPRLNQEMLVKHKHFCKV